MRLLDFLRVLGLGGSACLFLWDPWNMLWFAVLLWAILCHLMYREMTGRGMK